jgi:hypothetical protein
MIVIEFLISFAVLTLIGLAFYAGYKLGKK